MWRETAERELEVCLGRWQQLGGGDFAQSFRACVVSGELLDRPGQPRRASRIRSLAMMQLFGGFDEDCLAAYQEHYPLAEGWRERVSLHQLAPLIVHAIKFGRAYVGPTEESMSRGVCAAGEVLSRRLLSHHVKASVRPAPGRAEFAPSCVCPCDNS